MIYKKIKPEVSIAGAVVYRDDGEWLEFLVQRSKKNPDIWIFPKGHVEKGESKEDAALRELIEESGVKGQNLGFLYDFSVELNDEVQRITFYLFKFTGIAGEPEKGRDPRWLDVSAAMDCLTFDEYSLMIKMAIQRLAP